MRRFFNKLLRDFKTTSAARGGRRKPSIRVELLEARDVPTVVFMPEFGAEAIHGSTHDGMQDPGISLIFSGPSWESPQGQQDQAGMVRSVYGILNSPYLSGLKQYGSDGQAYLDPWAAVSDTVNVPTTGSNAYNADPGQVQDFLNKEINNPANHLVKPTNDDWQHARIYVVISDPGSSHGSGYGWNDQGSYEHSFFSHYNMHMIWMSTQTNPHDTHVSQDAFTNLFSHELAETLSDPDGNGITVTPPAGMPKSLEGKGVLQVCDNEPDGGRYQYRLGRTQDFPGVLVQAYWSNGDQAFIVPDGNSQKVFLYPNWNGSDFQRNFRLLGKGDQLGTNYSDRITLDDVFDEGFAAVKVTQNGESFEFEPGQIATDVWAAIEVETGGGANRVQINGVPSTIGLVTVQNGSGTDAVTIGNGSLAGISSATTIDVNSWGTGQSSVFVSGFLGGAADVTIDPGWIVYNGVRINNAGPGLTPANVEVDAGNGSRVDAEGVYYHTTVTVDVGSSDVVSGPAVDQIIVHRRPPVNPVGGGGGGGGTTGHAGAFV
jgi:hypothetical protein